jgi:hypothetical protein
LRQFFAILLLISFSVQLRGYHIYFHYRQGTIRKAAKKAIRQRIKEENTEEFIFTIATGHEKPEWENDHEVRFRGEMYDVIEKREENGMLYIRCISDEKERILVDNYRQVTKDDYAGTSEKRATLISKLIHPFYTEISLAGSDMKIRPQKEKWFTLIPSLLSAKAEVLTPPPRFV